MTCPSCDNRVSRDELNRNGIDCVLCDKRRVDERVKLAYFLAVIQECKAVSNVMRAAMRDMVTARLNTIGARNYDVTFDEPVPLDKDGQYSLLRSLVDNLALTRVSPASLYQPLTALVK